MPLVERQPANAFPTDALNSGLTKRELFAAMAMQGMLADSGGSGEISAYAVSAVKIADALIAALNEGGEA